MFKLRRIGKERAQSFISKYHYSPSLPKLNKVFLGGFIDNKLQAVMTLGYGTRPKHTIKKLFPSLDTQDYFENGRMCLVDELPKNSETQFISQVVKWIKEHYPERKLLFSWSDGMHGKPGYVYQAANFLYGGFIWTDSYFTEIGEKLHPRSVRSLCEEDAKERGIDKVFWLSYDFQRRNGVKRYKGKQYRYVLFLCSKGEKKRLLRESPFSWEVSGPKHSDLAWKSQEKEGYILCKQPLYSKAAQVSRVTRSISNGERQVQLLCAASRGPLK